MQAQSTKLSAEERKRLDRQRFIGLQTQRKLLDSRILITPANGPNTQLAKNLVLAGVNVSIYDSAVVSQQDFETNFLIAFDDIGKSRGQAVYNRIKQMNPTGNNQYFNQSININEIDQKFLERFTIICTSFPDFATLDKWDKLTKKANKPYYNMVSAGLYGFAYVSLGNKYTYKQPATKKQPKIFEIQCLSLNDCLDKSQVQKTKKKQFDILQCIIMMKLSQNTGLTYDVQNPMKMYQQMLNCMIDLGQDIKQSTQRKLLMNFAKSYGLDYCPVYSVIGSIISQQIIKVVQNQQEPAMNWIVMNSEEGYACVLKLKKQQTKISSHSLQNTFMNDN